jgi:integrative and conjugative element protein (TIGR02256 family)
VDAGPRARRERERFEPDGRWQKEQIAARYEASGRTLQYLGDWHSHPLGNGPSGLDRSTARRIAQAPNARCPHPVFLIVTRAPSGWELRAYRWARMRFARLDVRDR